jgi:hypothetical protein
MPAKLTMNNTEKLARFIRIRTTTGISGSVIRTAVLFLIPLALVFYYGIAHPYTTTADMDLAVAGHALNFNSGTPQTHYDHPGYVNFLLFSWWVKASSLLGLIPAHTWSGVLSSPDPESAFANVVITGRIYSAVIAGMLGVLFYHLLRLLTGSRHAALLGALALVFSAGLVHQASILRPELLSSLLVLLTLHQLIKAANGAGLRSSTVISLALAGGTAILALMTKLQAIVALLILPTGIILFGRRRDRQMCDVPGTSFTPEQLSYTLAAAAFASPALMLAATYIHASWVWPGPYLPLSGYYQILVATYLVGATLLYARIYKKTFAEWCIGLTALLTGMATASYLNFAKFLDQNIVALANFIDWLRHYTVSTISQNPDSTLLDMLQFVSGSASSLLTRYITIEGAQERPTVILLWTSLIVAGYLFAKRAWLPGSRILLFLALAILTELAFTLRYMDPSYLIYVEPWIIIAYALAISHLPGVEWKNMIVRTVATALTAAYILGSLQVSSGRTFLPSQNSNNNVCVFTQGTPIYVWTKHHCDAEAQKKYDVGK